MGYDIPSSIGAAMASPEKRVVCIVGDGSALMNIQELAYLKNSDLDIKIIVFNNIEKSNNSSFIYNLDMSYAASGVYLIKMGNSTVGFKTTRILVK